MGVQVTMTLETNKPSVVAATVATALATFPAANQVRLVTILPAADLHRLADIYRAILLCLDYARDNRVYTSAVSTAIVTTLNGGKSGIVLKALANTVVTNDVGIMLEGSVRGRGASNILDNAHKQVLEWMLENERLAA